MIATRLAVQNVICLVCLSGAMADDKLPAPDPDADLLKRVQVHPGVRAGGVGLLTTIDSRRMIAAVGVADVNSLEPSDRRNAEKAAELDARVRLAGFVGGEHLTVMTRSSAKTEVRSNSPTASVTEKYEERIAGTIDSHVRGTRLIGTYSSTDRKQMYAAVVLDDAMLGAVPSGIDAFPLFPRVVVSRGATKNTTSAKKDIEQALDDALFRAQLTAGGVKIYSFRLQQNDRPIQWRDQIEATGWVDSFEILSERRDGGQTVVVIRAVVVANPKRN